MITLNPHLIIFQVLFSLTIDTIEFSLYILNINKSMEWFCQLDIFIIIDSVFDIVIFTNTEKLIKSVYNSNLITIVFMLTTLLILFIKTVG